MVDPTRRFEHTSLAVLVALLLPSCGSTSNAVNAALNTAVALGAAGYERSQGGCYSSCVPGTHCNEETGYCDPVPCGGRCSQGEICRETVMGERCEPWGEVEMQPVGGVP